VRFLAVVVIAVAAAALPGADLDSVKAEPNLEKRAQRALDNADDSFKAAEDAYLLKGDVKRTGTALDELAASVELAYDSLCATHKNPSKSPKHFKRAEIRTRALLRRLDDFREQMNLDDREIAGKARAAVQKVHEELLDGIMGGKKHSP
jgi:hypothetical protein